MGCYKDTPAYAAIWPAPINPQYASVSYTFVDDVYLVPYHEYVTLHDTTTCSFSGLSLLPDQAADGIFIWNTGDTTPAITIHDTGKYWRIAQSNCASYTDTFRVHYQALTTPVIKDTGICQNIINRY